MIRLERNSQTDRQLRVCACATKATDQSEPSGQSKYSRVYLLLSVEDSADRLDRRFLLSICLVAGCHALIYNRLTHLVPMTPFKYLSVKHLLELFDILFL